MKHNVPVSKIRKTFAESGVNHLPVTSGDKLVGIISWTDMMRISFGESFGQDTAAEDAVLDHTHKLEDIMNADPVTIPSTGAIREAAEVLSEASFHSLPVVDDGKLVGILSTQDLIKYLRELY
jgi:CBS domain-containing protein